jgi:hypothetical protein
VNENRAEAHERRTSRPRIEALSYPAGVGHVEGTFFFRTTGHGERDRQGVAWVELIDSTGLTCLVREQHVPEISPARWTAVLNELSRETSRDPHATPGQ